jgi:DNA-binding CsgD family transcriptional regulator/tetratricopeptide (TPR) repeat protein
MGDMSVRAAEPVRRREFSALTSLLDPKPTLASAASATPEPPRVAYLRGEAGAGKSHLVDALEEVAAGSGWWAARGHAFPQELTGPFGPFVEVVGSLVDLAGGEQVATSLVSDTTWEVLGRLDPHRATPAVAPSGLELPRLVSATIELLGALAAIRPTLLILEDLHWADASSLGLALRLVRRPPDGCRLLVTWREPVLPGVPLQSVLGELLRCPGTVDVPLNPLSADAVRRLVTEAVPEAADHGVARAVRYADGNPFTALALARAGDDDPTAVPTTLSDILLPPTAALRPGAREALELLAVAARPVTWDCLAAAANLGDGELEAAADELSTARLLVADHDRLRLRHALLSEVVGASLPPGRRRNLHSRFADALIAHSGTEDVDAEIAGHLRAAGRHAESRSAALRAARQAATRSAYPEAVTLFEQALAPAGPPPGSATGAEGDPLRMLLEAADVSRWAEATDRGLAWIDRAAALAGEDRAKLAEVEHARGRVLWAHGDPGASLDAYRRAVDLLPPDAAVRLRARLTASLASGLMTMSRFAQARRVAAESLSLCGLDVEALPGTAGSGGPDVANVVDVAPSDDGPDATVTQHALVTWAVSAAQTGDLPTAEVALARARVLGRRGHDPDAASRAFANSVFVVAHAGRWKEAVALADEGLDWARGLGLGPAALPMLANNRISGLVAIGAWADAEQSAREALAQTPAQGVGLMLHLTLAELAALRGDDVEAELGRALAMPGAESDPLVSVYAACARAEAALWRGDARTARDHVAAGLAVPEASQLPHETLRLVAQGLRAEADLDRSTGGSGRTAERVAIHERAESLLRLAPQSLGEENPALRAGRLLVEAERLRLESGAAGQSQAWTAAADAWTAVQELYPVAYCTWRAARAEFAIRRTAAGTALLRSATELADHLGARPLVEACSATARAAGVERDLALQVGRGETIDLRQASPTPPDPWRLTAREGQVLRLLAQGLSNRQVGLQLGISEKTVSVHLSNLYAKLGVTSRTEAVSAMIRTFSKES